MGGSKANHKSFKGFGGWWVHSFITIETKKVNRKKKYSLIATTKKMTAGEAHDHDHDHEDELGLSLQGYIDMTGVYCLNEHRSNAGRDVLKPFDDRLTEEPSLQSPREDEDLELLFHIPFSEAVKIRSLCINSRASIFVPNGDASKATSAPASVKVFANRTDLDFESARELEPDLKLDLAPPEHYHELPSVTTDEAAIGATLDYPLRPGSKFRCCNSITLFFEDNFASKAVEEAGGEEPDEVIPTEITYVGFKGEGTSLKRVAVETVYETRGMKKDHTVPGGEFGAESKPGF